MGQGATDLDERFSDPKAKKEITVALEDHRDHFDSINLQMGGVYGKDRATKNSGSF